MPQPYIFISHSTADEDFTEFLAGCLRDAGFSVWVDVDSIPDGSTWLREIEKGVTDCASMVVVMSKAGRESEWVERETLLAMDLRKPLFVARIDDTPLPLHLINRQFTDFRADQDRAARKLLAAVRKISQAKPVSRRQPAILSPEPDKDNFFKYLQQLPGGEDNVLIARDLYTWARDQADSVTFGGKFTPGFHVRVQQGDNEVTVFSLWAYPRHPAVQVQFQYLSSVSPYDQRSLRLSTLKSLNRLTPDDDPFIEDKADRRPTLSLARAFKTAEGLETFKQIMAEIIDNLHSGE